MAAASERYRARAGAGQLEDAASRSPAGVCAGRAVALSRAAAGACRALQRL